MSFFEISTLKEIMDRNPGGHKQTEFHVLSFYVLVFVTKGEVVHFADLGFIRYADFLIDNFAQFGLVAKD